MTKRLIYLALVCIPFVIHLSFLPLIPVIEGNTRLPKTNLSLIFILSIILSALFCGGLKSYRNKWPLIFLLFLPLSVLHSPPFIISLGEANFGGMWQWRPLFSIFLYFILMIIIASINIDFKFIRRIFQIISTVALIMSLYVFLQKLKLDQFFHLKSVAMLGYPTEPRLMGTMGNSTLVSAFLVMCVPFILFLKQWWRSVLIIIAVILCKSHMSTGALMMILLIYAFISLPKARVHLIYSTILVLGICSISVLHDQKLSEKLLTTTGRKDVWKNAINDLRSPPIQLDPNTPGLSAIEKEYVTQQNDHIYALTGIGLGSFRIIYGEKHKRPILDESKKLMGYNYPRWGNPHNEYINIAYSLGLVGLCLALIVAWSVLWRLISIMKIQAEAIPLFVSLISIMTLSFGTFVLSIEPIQLYTAVIAGMAQNRWILTGEET